MAPVKKALKIASRAPDIPIEFLSQIEGSIIGVLGLSEFALSAQEVYEGVLISEVWRYVKIEERRGDKDAHAKGLEFEALMMSNREREAKALFKSAPFSSYNLVSRHLEFLREGRWVECRSVKGRKAKKVWRLTEPVEAMFDKAFEKGEVFKLMAEALKSYFRAPPSP